jgi:RNA polymerase sigma factor (TIGR02999 family)
MALIYRELRLLAAHYLRNERREHTWQPTALVHEVYLRLIESEPVAWQNRAHFFAVAAQQMRRLLVDHARARLAEKRGGRGVRISVKDVADRAWRQEDDVLAVDEALCRLNDLDSRAAQAVELRFFGGLDERETAEVLGISIATLKRDWVFARAWLFQQLRGSEENH